MTSRNHTIKPEIMSPAGYWPQLNAAIEAGADAIYFGLKHFTARAKVGFSLAELPEVMRTLHGRGVKGYVTFNTLVFDHELAEAAKTLAEIASAGADSIIVQDVGIAQLAHKIAPDLAIHGSTQMSITSAEGIALAQQFGVSRVVLARELSLDEIRTIRGQSACELEIFVHGALCVSYSGQCFSSEAWGGRSANRGQCAQACRLPYEMIVDEQLKPLGDARYLLSPGDLYALHQIPEIVEIGIHALKIEGRYKDADYVALTTAAYRKAVDEAWLGLAQSVSRSEEIQLEQVYSRGLAPHFITGVNHQEVVQGRAPRHRGVQAGRVTKVLLDRVMMIPDPAIALAPLKPGDGIVFDAASWRSPEQPEEGGRIYQVTPQRKGEVELKFGNGAIKFHRIRPGDLIWRTHDPELDKVARRFTEAAAPVHRQPLRARITAHEGAPLQIDWAMVEDLLVTASVCSDEPLGAAQNRAVTESYLQEQLGRLGNTPYALAEIELDLQGNPFIPTSLLNHLRRQAVEELTAIQSQERPITVNAPLATLDQMLHQQDLAADTHRYAQIDDTITEHAARNTQHVSRFTPHVSSLHLLVRTPEQLDAAVDLHPASITLDYLDLYGLRPAVERVRAAGIEVRVASPRILKPGEERILNFLRRLNAPILVRSAGLLHTLAQGDHPPLIGDFSLNAANVLSAENFLNLGLERFTPTYDLNAAQVTALAAAIGADKVEVVAYQHLPVFHTEHCVFCRFLSEGTSYKDCGQPCEKHRVALRDMNGREHPVMADVGCRNTVFGAEAQEASAHLAEWQAVGIRHFRLEFVHENASQVTEVTRAFQAALSGKLPARQLAQRLQQIAPQGTSEGSLFVSDGYLELPLI
jgi:U32 family peptidase